MNGMSAEQVGVLHSQTMQQTMLKRRQKRRAMRRHALTAAMPLALAALLAGCATLRTTPAQDYAVLAAKATAGEMVPPAALKRAFFAAPDFAERMQRLRVLETQALRALDQEPLRLGAVGSAILDHYYGSLAGHEALVRFYSHLESDEQAAWHRAWVAAIKSAIESSEKQIGEERASPTAYVALSDTEAEAFLIARGQRTVGGRYQVDDERFLLWLSAGREGEGVSPVLFDLGDLYATVAAAVNRDRDTVMPVDRPMTCATFDICADFNTYAFARVLALSGDSAAQTFIGWEMKAIKRLDDAGRWLEQASADQNALASLLLADVFLLKALAAGSDRASWLAGAERNLLLAISAGFDSAMLRLGVLYLGGEYGEENVAEGEPLIRRAADLDNVEALLRLGGWHAGGTVLNKDMALSEQYFHRAAELDDQSKVHYARFLTHPEVGRNLNDQAWRWLREVAKEGDPEAMLLIGDLYARGEHVSKSLRRAKSWFRNVVKATPDNAHFVNEVAWRLAASSVERLRDERYALKIMDRVMADEGNEARRNPAYLDTWAAAFAANGEFERAIAVQEKAIELARDNGDPNGELGILTEHLNAFRARQVISDDTVP